MTRLEAILAEADMSDPKVATYVNQYMNEVNQTRAGHWHPNHVACTVKCPMGDPRTASAFRRVLNQGARI